ncbi:MAG: N-acetylmuramoyl-L-alanine amidase [Thermoleophilia bacterium]|nr:N-acetylmuramoyl-L-alanine amidase [Thermoleophilia bacterium]
MPRPAALALALLPLFVPAAQGADAPGTPLQRQGDEIVACGQLFHTGTPVVLWTDPGGYDAYRVERRFAPPDQAGWEATQKAGVLKSPSRFGARTRGLSPALAEKVRNDGWALDDLRQVVDQFVIHFDARGTSRGCFQILHDLRGLSVHFMLDVDGTIYQTLDLKESAWHATIANGRSIGIEIANVGAYPLNADATLARWYGKDDAGKTILTIPGGAKAEKVRHPELVLRPDRNDPVVGEVQGQQLRQYDLTPQQYAALAKLTAALCTVFPKIRCDYPRDASGKLVTRKLPEAEFDAYQGVLGHYHVQTNKVDPGPAFQWDRLIGEARGLMGR